MKRGSKFVGHSTEIIRQSKIKGPLAILPTHGLIILTKLDETKIVDFLLVVYFWAGIIFFNQSLIMDN